MSSYAYGRIRAHQIQKMSSPTAARLVKKNMDDSVKLFKCPHCPFKTKHRKSVKSHIRHVHSNHRPFKCPLCPYKAKGKGNLKRHEMDIHSGLKPHKCQVPNCDYTTAQKISLTLHMRTHTGERPHQCRLCHQKFSRKDHLVGHMRTHTGEKPFKCHLCPFATACSSTVLKRHLKTHDKRVERTGSDTKGHPKIKNNPKKGLKFNEEKMFNCKFSHCKFVTDQEKELAKHLNGHTVPFVLLKRSMFL